MNAAVRWRRRSRRRDPPRRRPCTRSRIRYPTRSRGSSATTDLRRPTAMETQRWRPARGPQQRAAPTSLRMRSPTPGARGPGGPARTTAERGGCGVRLLSTGAKCGAATARASPGRTGRPEVTGSPAAGGVDDSRRIHDEPDGDCTWARSSAAPRNRAADMQSPAVLVDVESLSRRCWLPHRQNLPGAWPEPGQESLCLWTSPQGRVALSGYPVY